MRWLGLLHNVGEEFLKAFFRVLLDEEKSPARL